MLLEPASSVTDFALGVLAIGAALLIERNERVNHHWRLSFLFIGLAAILGGVHHGFIGPDGTAGAVSWAVIILSIAVAISFLLSATIASVLGEGRGRPLMIIRGVSLLAFLILVILGRATLPALLVTEGLAMIMVVLLWVHAWRDAGPGGNRGQCVGGCCAWLLSARYSGLGVRYQRTLSSGANAGDYLAVRSGEAPGPALTEPEYA